MTDACTCGRRVVRLHGNGALGVVQVAQFDRDADGRCVLVGPFGTPGELRHVDNTPACSVRAVPNTEPPASLPPGDQ